MRARDKVQTCTCVFVLFFFLKKERKACQSNILLAKCMLVTSLLGMWEEFIQILWSYLISC